MRFPLIGPGYTGRSTALDPSRSVNLYPEVSAADSKSVLSLSGTPGTLLWANVGALIVRGFHAFNGLLYVVVGNGLYSVDVNGNVSSVLGTLSTSIGRVVMKDNGLQVSGVGGNQLMIVDGAAGYIYNVSTGAFTPSASFTGGGGTGTCAFPSTGANALEYMDGYFIVSQTDSMNVFCSDLYNGLSWNTLAVASIEAAPDTVHAIWNEQEQLFFVKEYTSEVWYNAGIATAVGFPFLRMTGAVLDYGTPASASVARGSNGLFALGNRRVGDGFNFIGAIRITADSPSVISPPAITYQMQKWAPWNDVFGYCYEQDGHQFYVVTSPSANQTFVYDASIGDPMIAWHERSTYTGSPYEIGRHVSNCYAFFNGLHLVGDYQNGNIYQMKTDVYRDNGNPLVAIRTCQPIFDKRDLNNIFIRKLQVDAETGVSAVGLDSQIALDWSDDGGNKWSNSYPVSLGKTGQYKTRAVWRRLGCTRSRIFRVTISAPVKRTLIAGYVT
jgi:hypothetical protein